MSFKTKIAICLVFFLASMSAFSDHFKRVLYISSYHPGFSTFFQQVNGIKDILEEIPIIFDIEFMDTKRFPHEENWVQFRNRLEYKLDNLEPYDIILVGDDNAHLFAIDEKNILFDNTPIVFLGVNNVLKALEQNDDPQITGVVEAVSMEATINLMISQIPEAENIIAIVDSTTSGQGDLISFYELEESFQEHNFMHMDLSGMSWDELSLELRTLNDSSSLLLLSAYIDKNNDSKLFEDSLQLIREAVSIPLYHLWLHGLGDGVLGGKVISHFEQGKSAALMVMDIFSGVSVKEIPVLVDSPNEYVFDNLLLEEFQIDRETIPPGSRILNLPYSFYQSFKKEIWLISGFFITFIVFIIILLQNIYQKHNIQKHIIKSNKELEESEAKLQAILDNSPALISLKDHNGTIIMANKQFSILDGPSPEEYIGKNVYEMFSKDVADKLWKNDLKAIETNRPVEIEEVAKGKNGTLLTFLTYKFPVYVGNDKPFGVCAISTDISERKKADRELQYLRNYLSNIIDYMPSVLIGVDSEFTITMWNEKAARETGIGIDDAKGQKLVDAYPYLSSQLEKISESISNQKIYKEKKREFINEKDLTFLDITIYPLVNDDFKGAVIRIDDVTEQVKMDEVIIQNEKMLSIGGLAAGMAHEINNPLAGILQSADVLNNRLKDNLNMPVNIKAAEKAGTNLKSLESFLDARGILRLIDSIHEAGKRAAIIVQNMLAFARNEDTKVSTSNIEELFDRTVELASTEYNLNTKFDFKEISIIKEVEDNIPSIICESSKIQQVFLNLLKNGAEAMATDLSVKPQFIFRLKKGRNKSHIIIELEDNGPGIEEETRKRIFEPFFSTKPVGVGTGLGLSISFFIIVENHHGEMSVESSPGYGSRFIIKLPINSGK